jgi:exonuclease SbcD
LAEILIEEERKARTYCLEELLTNESEMAYRFLKGSIKFKECDCRDVKILTKGEDINDFSPLQLFEKRLEQDESIDNNQDLINAFKEIMESLIIGSID